MIRSMNEDAFFVGDSVFAVADGMGGHLAGEVASAMAIEALTKLGETDVDSLALAVLDANDQILQMSRADASRRGMGTTLTAVALVHATDDSDASAGMNAKEHLAIINLGDSRTYRMRNGHLEQVTIDHSYVQELVSAGHLTADEARFHPQRNIVTRALGIEPDVGLDVWTLDLVKGDRFLLCSDGLVDEVADEQIESVLRELPEPQAAADALVDLANRFGGRDNVTVVVIDVLEGADAPTESEPDREQPTLEVPLVADGPADPLDGSSPPTPSDLTILAGANSLTAPADPPELDHANRAELATPPPPDLDEPATELIEVDDTPTPPSGQPIEPVPPPPPPAPDTDAELGVPVAASLLSAPPPDAPVLEPPAVAPSASPPPGPAVAASSSRRTGTKIVTGAVIAGLVILLIVVLLLIRGGDDEPTPTTIATTVAPTVPTTAASAPTTSTASTFPTPTFSPTIVPTAVTTTRAPATTARSSVPAAAPAPQSASNVPTTTNG
jgi:protein phosphatase